MIVAGRRVRLTPPEGWLTVGLVLLMCLTLAWSVDDARVVLGRDAFLDFLPWAAVGGVAAGFIGPMVGWGRWRTYLVGALVAAIVLPLIVGTILPPGGGDLGVLFRRTSAAAVAAFGDLVILRRLSTPEVGHHLLVLGLVVWGTSMFASYAVFGHRRPLNAVLLIGILLIVNMAFTLQNQLMFLVLFSLAAMFLLIRLHTFEEQTEWLRRRIGDPSALSGMYLRGGTIFIVLAVVASLLLTNVAASDPLAGAWRDIGAKAIDWSRGLARFLPQSGTGPVIGPSFGSSVAVSGSWNTNNDPALTIEIPPELLALKPYWRTVVHDELLFEGFRVSEDETLVDRAADEPLLDGLREAVVTEGRQLVSYRITSAASVGSHLFAPQTPVSVDIASTLTLVDGEDGYFGQLERRDGSGAYLVTSALPRTGDDVEGGLTQNRLRVAGEAYPEDIVARYAAPPEDGILGPSALLILEDIRQLGATNPYDLASAIEDYLKDDDNIKYDSDIQSEKAEQCANLSFIECFARIRAGYCEYYAGTMVALLREEGVPARIAEGYLPGERAVSTGVETVRNSRAHAWVEVYFPNYGWVDFDPTGGGVAALETLPPGREQPSQSPGPSSSATLIPRTDDAGPSRSEPDGGGGTIRPSSPVGPLIVVALLLAVGIGLLAAIAWRRGPRGPVSADGAYGSVTRLATRLGFGPRPNQTVYEYAGVLADILPDARPELETVARAKVEVVYGGRALGPDRLASLREAHRRLRVSLLRLVLRRRDRRRR